MSLELDVCGMMMLEEVATLLKALGDSNRLRMFAELIKGDTCNAELNEALGLASNVLSHHLRVLSDADLIHSHRVSDLPNCQARGPALKLP